MKNSVILLIVSALLIGLKLVKPEITGVLVYGPNEKPKNGIVKFWEEKYKIPSQKSYKFPSVEKLMAGGLPLDAACGEAGHHVLLYQEKDDEHRN